MSNATPVTDSDFKAQVLDSDKPVLVDFWAAWCGPCKMIAPVIDEIATEYSGKIKVAKLDVDSNKLTAGQFQVMSIPTLLLFKNGKAVERIVGYVPKAQIAKAITPHL